MPERRASGNGLVLTHCCGRKNNGIAWKCCSQIQRSESYGFCQMAGKSWGIMEMALPRQTIAVQYLSQFAYKRGDGIRALLRQSLFKKVQNLVPAFPVTLR